MTAPIPEFDEGSHRYSHEGRPYQSVTQILTGLKLTPPYPPDTGQQARGTAIHRAAELAVWDRLDDSRTSQEILPYIEGLRVKMAEMKIRPILTEVRGVHLAECYAGTTDLLCTVFDAELAIIDYKSGTPPRCVQLQTAGYGELLAYMESLKAKPLFTRDKMPRRFSMELTPNRAIIRECTDPYDYHAWLGAVRLFKWLQEHRKD